MNNSPYANVVDQIFKQFDTNKSQRLDVAELTNYYNAFNFHNAIPYRFDQNFVKGCLKSYDINNDNKITKQQFLLLQNRYPNRHFPSMYYPGLCDLSQNQLKEKLKEYMQRFDTNKSGRLNKTQLTNFYNYLYRNAGMPLICQQTDSEKFLIHHKKHQNQGFDQMDLYHIIRNYKQNPTYI